MNAAITKALLTTSIVTFLFFPESLDFTKIHQSVKSAVPWVQIIGGAVTILNQGYQIKKRLHSCRKRVKSNLCK